MTIVKSMKKIVIYVASRCLCKILEALAFILFILFNRPKRSAIPPIVDRNLVTPAVKLSQQMRDGQLTSEQVVQSFIKRIKSVNPIINAVVFDRFEKALDEAREIDRRIAAARAGNGDTSILKMPLVGVPVSVKETIAIEGHPYTGGLKARKLTRAAKNADAVDLLQKNGLIPIALTNIPELAMWWDSNNPVYGATNNPYDLSRIPGGSSGGEAALLASAGSVVGIGSDIAGSIRIPANFCGVFGHKPTPKIVSTEGMFPYCNGEREMLLGLGPMTRYACDLVPMLKVLAGPKVDQLKLDEPVDMSSLKLYYIEDFNDPLASGCNTDIIEGMRSAIKYLVDKFKISAEKVYLDELKFGFLLWAAEANKEPNLPTFAELFKDGNGQLSPFVELLKKVLNLSDHTFNSIFFVALEKFSPSYGSSTNKMLIRKAAQLRKKFNGLVGDNGVLLMPTHPEPAPLHQATATKILNVSYTAATAVLQAPITQVPLGLSKEGLPYGAQVFARPLNDRLTLAVAKELEQFTGGWSAPCRIDL
uniref:Fatty-acid amide hydrolase 2 n=1 Tax=Aceria tosichella TaxID=561515 RepID=A0A6G1SMF3_9ACAR